MLLVGSDQDLNAIELDALDLEFFQTDPIFEGIFTEQPIKGITLHLPSNAMTHTSLGIPPTPSSLVQQITQRPANTTSSQSAASLIFSTLKSYARMLINSNKPPPFIHYSSLFPESELHVSESLANCPSLIKNA